MDTTTTDLGHLSALDFFKTYPLYVALAYLEASPAKRSKQPMYADVSAWTQARFVAVGDVRPELEEAMEYCRNEQALSLLLNREARRPPAAAAPSRPQPTVKPAPIAETELPSWARPLEPLSEDLEPEAMETQPTAEPETVEPEQAVEKQTRRYLGGEKRGRKGFPRVTEPPAIALEPPTDLDAAKRHVWLQASARLAIIDIVRRWNRLGVNPTLNKVVDRISGMPENMLRGIAHRLVRDHELSKRSNTATKKGRLIEQFQVADEAPKGYYHEGQMVTAYALWKNHKPKEVRVSDRAVDKRLKAGWSVGDALNRAA